MQSTPIPRRPISWRPTPGPAPTALIASALIAALVAPASGQQAALRDSVASAPLTRLAAAVERGRDGAADDFWRSARERGTPLVEPAPEAGHSVVTFVYRGGPGVEGVRLESNLSALLIQGVTTDFDSLGGMERMPGTDVWQLSFRLRNDIRVPYRFEVRAADSTRSELDPLNPSVWEPEREGLAASILELPGAPPQPWRAFSESDRGDWDQWRFEEGPDSGRIVYIYKPESWDPERPEPYPVLVGLGAFSHGIGMRVDRVVDHLIDAGRLEPTVVVLPDLGPASAATGYRSTTDFVADRLLPGLRSDYNLAEEPERVVLSGTSRRGMAASLVALRRPDAVGNVLSLSGSYYWKPADRVEYEWAAYLYARRPRQPVRFYLTAGELETVVTPGNAGHYMVATNRRFRDVLLARGYRVTYTEFNGVHSELSWQDELARGLAHLVGPGG